MCHDHCSRRRRGVRHGERLLLRTPMRPLSLPLPLLLSAPRSLPLSRLPSLRLLRLLQPSPVTADAADLVVVAATTFFRAHTASSAAASVATVAPAAVALTTAAAAVFSAAVVSVAAAAVDSVTLTAAASVEAAVAADDLYRARRHGFWRCCCRGCWRDRRCSRWHRRGPGYCRFRCRCRRRGNRRCLHRCRLGGFCRRSTRLRLLLSRPLL